MSPKKVLTKKRATKKTVPPAVPETSEAEMDKLAQERFLKRTVDTALDVMSLIKDSSEVIVAFGVNKKFDFACRNLTWAQALDHLKELMRQNKEQAKKEKKDEVAHKKLMDKLSRGV